MNQHDYYDSARLEAAAQGRKFNSMETALAYLNQEKLECLLCGSKFDSLAKHLYMSHHVRARDYKFAFNLPRMRGLWSCSLAAHMRDKLVSDPARLAASIELGKQYGPARRGTHIDDCNRVDYSRGGKRRDNPAVIPPVVELTTSAPPNLLLQDPDVDFVPVGNGRYHVRARKFGLTDKPVVLKGNEADIFHDERSIPPKEKLQSTSSYDSKSIYARVERIEKTLRILAFALETFSKDSLK